MKATFLKGSSQWHQMKASNYRLAVERFMERCEYEEANRADFKRLYHETLAVGGHVTPELVRQWCGF